MKKLLLFLCTVSMFTYALKAAAPQEISAVLEIHHKFLTDKQIERIHVLGKHAAQSLWKNVASLKSNNRETLIRQAHRYGADPEETKIIFDLNGYSAAESYLEPFYICRFGTLQERQALLESKKKSCCCQIL